MTMPQSLQDWLKSHGIRYKIIPHPRSLSSKELSETAHVPPDHIAKAVIVKDEAGYAMVVIPGSDWLRLHALREETGRAFELATEAEVDALFSDCEPGAVPPVGMIWGLDTFLDEKLLSLANVYFEAGDHHHLVHIRGENLHALLPGARHGIFSHDE